MNTWNTGWNGTTCWPNTNGLNCGINTNGTYGCPPAFGGFNGGFSSPFVGTWGVPQNIVSQPSFCGPTFAPTFTPTWNQSFGQFPNQFAGQSFNQFANQFPNQFANQFAGQTWCGPVGCPTGAPIGTSGSWCPPQWNGFGFCPPATPFANCTPGFGPVGTPWGFAPNGCLGSACPDYTGAGCCMTTTSNGWSTPTTVVSTCFGPLPIACGTQCVPTMGCTANGTPISGIIVNGCFLPLSLLATLCFGTSGATTGFNGYANPIWNSAPNFGAQWFPQTMTPGVQNPWNTVRANSIPNCGVPSQTPGQTFGQNYGQSYGQPFGQPTGQPVCAVPTNPFAPSSYTNGAKPFNGPVPGPIATPGQPAPVNTVSNGNCGPGYMNAVDGCCQPMARNAA